MPRAAAFEPGWVGAILNWRWTWPLARVALTSAYLVGGFTKLVDFPGAIAEQEHFGLHPGWVFASLTLCVELLGAALVVSGWAVWFGAGMLGVFTGLAALIASPFWRLAGQARFVAINALFEHVGLIAGLVMSAIIAEHVRRRRGAEAWGGWEP